MTHKIQIDDLVRDMTVSEQTKYDADQTEHASQKILEAQVAAAKLAAHASAVNKLKALGLTDNEISAIIG